MNNGQQQGQFYNQNNGQNHGQGQNMRGGQPMGMGIKDEHNSMKNRVSRSTLPSSTLSPSSTSSYSVSHFLSILLHTFLSLASTLSSS